MFKILTGKKISFYFIFLFRSHTRQNVSDNWTGMQSSIGPGGQISIYVHPTTINTIYLLQTNNYVDVKHISQQLLSYIFWSMRLRLLLLLMIMMILVKKIKQTIYLLLSIFDLYTPSAWINSVKFDAWWRGIIDSIESPHQNLITQPFLVKLPEPVHLMNVTYYSSAWNVRVLDWHYSLWKHQACTKWN